MSKRSPLTFDLGKAPLGKTPLDKGSAPTKHAKIETGLPKNAQPRKQANDTAPSTKVRRAGRVFIAAHVLPEAAKQFKLMSVQQERTAQALLIEAINDLFAKYGLSRIADDI